MNRVRLFDNVYREIAIGVSWRLTRRKQAGEPTSVDMLVCHAEVILAGLLTTADPLHAVLPPLDIAFQEDPSVAKEILLGKVGRVLSVGARLVHAYETLRKVDVPCPLAAETRQDVNGRDDGWTHATHAGMFCCGLCIIVIG